MIQLAEVLRAVYRKDLSVLESLPASAVNARDEDGRTPLMHAILAEDADPWIVRLLIERGADVNVQDRGEKWTPLHFAARDLDEPIVRLLLEAGAEVDAVDVNGNTPLMRSVMESTPRIETIRALVQHGAAAGRKNARGVAPIDLARRKGRADIVTMLEQK